MKLRIISIFILGFAALAPLNGAEAHQPRIVAGTTETVEKSDVSKAYYGVLQGTPHEFSFTHEDKLPLYLSLLSPKTFNAHTDFIARLYKDEHLVATLDGTLEPWHTWYEPFGGDTYWQGPEFIQQVPAGNYRVVVSNSDNQGAYTFAIGTQESFTPTEIVRTLAILPIIKEDFFHQTWMAAVFNRAMLGLSAIIVFAVLLVMIIRKSLAHYHTTRAALTPESMRVRPRLGDLLDNETTAKKVIARRRSTKRKK